MLLHLVLKEMSKLKAERIRFTGEIRHSLMKRACENDRSSDDKELIPTDEIVELLESRYILHEDAKSAGGEMSTSSPAFFLLTIMSSLNLEIAATSIVSPMLPSC